MVVTNAQVSSAVEDSRSFATSDNAHDALVMASWVNWSGFSLASVRVPIISLMTLLIDGVFHNFLGAEMDGVFHNFLGAEIWPVFLSLSPKSGLR